MEIQAQDESKGILYEGYADAFKQCIFEDGAIQGRNERYEFRCDAHLECCGRSCCIPDDSTVPLWLVILFIILGLLLLAAILGLLAYLFAKRKRKPKVVKDLNNGGYRTIRHIDDDANNKEYSALDETANTGGYGNRAYDRAADLSGLEQRGARIRRRGSESEEEELYRMNANPNHGANVNTSHLTRYPIDPPPVPRRNSWHEHETYEEEFKEEIEYGRSAASSRGSSQKFVPSPIEETLIAKPQPVQIVQHNEDEISRASIPETMALESPQTQKAQHAFYRPFIPDSVEEQLINPADRGQITYHDVAAFAVPKHPSYTTLERPKERKADHMYTRPGMDNVPSY